MSIYNIKTSETRDFYSTIGWDLGINLYRINENDLYDPDVVEHTNGEHISIIDESLEPAPPVVDRFSSGSLIDSSVLFDRSNFNTVADPLINLSNNPNITLSRLFRPIHNSAPSWRYY